MAAHANSESIASVFSPGIAQWFTQTLGEPTQIQKRAWPEIRSGSHVLVSAPTGSGKTLTAFLAAIDDFATGRLQPGTTRVLYVSPLKALNNDVERNLTRPLQELQERLAGTEAGERLQQVRVRTRSGDTPADERRRLLRHAPEILITTPESLNLMLSTTSGQLALRDVEVVIVDEIHALADNRRGVLMSTAMERILSLGATFQRIGISATVKPLAAVGQFLAGFDCANHSDEPIPRPVTTIAQDGGSGSKKIELEIDLPAAISAQESSKGKAFWQALAVQLTSTIEAHKTTLIFVNNRTLTEKLTFLINEHAQARLAYAHHGSLAREIRLDVEAQMKRGDLRAIVATSSLELGIDIGALDLVVHLQSPGRVSSGLQRIGRAGHQVGATSHGLLLPTHAHDLLELSAISAAMNKRDIEPLKLPRQPLDILAQIIIGSTAAQPKQASELLTTLRGSYSYAGLSFDQFDSVLEQLKGRYAASRIRVLKRRLDEDPGSGALKASKGAVLAMYQSGGTIPDRGYYTLKHASNGAKIGELDEEFVWEARVGQHFSFGSAAWQIERITADDVFATPAPESLAPPFWRAETLNRDAHTSAYLQELLHTAEQHLRDKKPEDFQAALRDSHSLSEGAARELCDYLQRQRAANKCSLPHRRHLVLEKIASGPGGYESPDGSGQMVLQTFWGGTVNRPYAIALHAAWFETHGFPLEISASNDFLAIQSPPETDVSELLQLVNAENVQHWLARGLDQSRFFGARFRESAHRAMLLPKPSFGRRLPLWMARQRAKEMLAKLKKHQQFPVLVEAWRSCIEDEFDLGALIAHLHALEAGHIEITTTERSTPSPFASNITWSQINDRYMYADDTPLASLGASQQGGLPEAALGWLADQQQHPLDQSLIITFETRLKRLEPGYLPESPAELIDLVSMLLTMPASDWQILITQHHTENRLIAFDELNKALVVLHWATAEQPQIVTKRDAVALLDPPAEQVSIYTLESLEALSNATTIDPATTQATLPARSKRDARSPAELMLSWLASRGPCTIERIAAALPFAAEHIRTTVQELLEHEALVRLPVGEGVSETYCHPDTWEQLLRWQRRSARLKAENLLGEALPPTLISAWLSDHQGPCGSDDMEDDNSITAQQLEQAVQKLSGWPSAPDVLEEDLLVKRAAHYSPDKLDKLLRNEQLGWHGAGKGKVVIYPETDRHLLTPQKSSLPQAIADVFTDSEAAYGFHQLMDRSSLTAWAF